MPSLGPHHTHTHTPPTHTHTPTHTCPHTPTHSHIQKHVLVGPFFERTYGQKIFRRQKVQSKIIASPGSCKFCCWVVLSRCIGTDGRCTAWCCAREVSPTRHYPSDWHKRSQLETENAILLPGRRTCPPQSTSQLDDRRASQGHGSERKKTGRADTTGTAGRTALFRDTTQGTWPPQRLVSPVRLASRWLPCSPPGPDRTSDDKRDPWNCIYSLDIRQGSAWQPLFDFARS